MSSSPTVESTSRSGDPLVDRAEGFIDRQLARAASQVRMFDLLGGVLTWSASILGALLLLAIIDAWVMPLSSSVRWLALIGMVVGSIAYLILRIGPPLIRRINPMFAARMVEESRPELKNGLVNVLSLREHPDLVRRKVLNELTSQTATNLSAITVDSAIDRAHVIRIGYAFVALLAFAGLYKIFSPKDPFTTISRIVAPLADVAPPSRVRILEVRPGDVDIRFGDPLNIEVEVEGLSRNATAILKYTTDDGQAIDEPLVLAWDESRGHFSGVLSTSREASGTQAGGIQHSLDYRIEAGDARSQTYRVEVAARPTTMIEKIELIPPGYTALPPRIITDRGDVDGLEGTEVILVAKANVPITSASLELLSSKTSEAQPGAIRPAAKRIPLTLTGQQGTVRFKLELDEDRKTPKYDSYRIQLLTEEGLTDANPVHYRIAVYPDLAPEIKWTAPTETSVSVKLNGRLMLRTEAYDADFHVSKVMLYGEVQGRRIISESLLDASRTPDDRHLGMFRFEPEKLGLSGGEEVVFVAEVSDDRRHPVSGQPDPNISRTAETITVKVQAERENNSGNGGGNNGGGGRAGNSDGAASEGTEGESGESGAGGEAGESNEGESSGDSQEGESGESGSSGGSSSVQENSETGESGMPPMPGSGGSGQGSGSQSDEESQGSGGSGNSSSNDSSESQSDGGNGGNGGESSPAGASGGTSASEPSDGASSETETAEGAAPSGTGSGAENSQPSQDQGGEQGSNDATPEAGEMSNGSSGRSAPKHEGEAFERILEQMRRDQQESGSETGGQTGEQSASETGGQTGEQSASETGGQTGEQSASETGGQTGEQSASETGGQTGEQSASETGGQTGEQSASETGAQTGEQSASETGGQTGEQSASETGGQTGEQSASETGGQTGEPSASETGGQTGEPSASETGGQTGEQSASETGGQTGEQSASETGGQTGEQSASETGGQTGEQSASETGGQTGEQSANETGGQTGEPSASETGGQTGEPSASETGGQTGEPSASETGGQTGEQSASETGGQTGSGEDSSEASTMPNSESPNNASEDPASAGSSGSGNAPGSQDGYANRDAEESTDPRGRSSNTRPGEGEPIAASETPREGELPPGEAANLEYARQATDLVLDYLSKQKEDPNPELLDELGWTEEQLRSFAERWEAMRKAAEQGSVEDRRRLDDRLRSLGLMPQVDQAGRVRQQTDNVGGLNQDGTRSRPPAAFAEKFRQFLRGASQAESREPTPEPADR